MSKESVNLVEYLNKLEKIIDLQKSYISLLEENTAACWFKDDIQRREFLKMEISQLNEE